MKHFFITFTLLLIGGLMLPLQAQSPTGKKSVTMTITREANGITQTIDTSFYVNDASEVEGILRDLGIDEPKEGQTLEKRIVIRDIEEDGPEQTFEVTTSYDKPMIGVYLTESDNDGGFNFNFWSSDDEDDSEGVTITGLTRTGKADIAGLKKGDVIINLDGATINSIEDVSDAKEGYRPGDQMAVVYLRDGRSYNTTVTLTPRSSGHSSHHKQTQRVKVTTQKTFLGVVPSSVNNSTARRLDLPSADGVLLEEIVSGHSAEAAGLEENDVIVRMAGQTVSDNGDLRDVLSSHQPGDNIRIDYYRDGRLRSTNVSLGGKTQTHWKNVDASDAQKVEEKRAYLGVYLETNGDDEGVRITRVSNNTAADDAGLEDDDVIIRIGSYDTPNYSALVKALRSYEPNDRVAIRYIRDDRYGSTTVTLGSKTVTKWVMKDKVKSQAIDVDIIIKEFDNKEEAEELVRHIQDPSLEMPDFTVYPNPNNGRFNLRFSPDGDGPIRIKVYNFNGQIVYQEQLTDFYGTYDKMIDISDNAEGNYFLQVTQNGEGMAKKLVVRK